jgi:hypothetical protein
MEKLKPCPFCGSNNLLNIRSFVHCQNCMANGPYIFPPKENITGIELWNGRNVDE